MGRGGKYKSFSRDSGQTEFSCEKGRRWRFHYENVYQIEFKEINANGGLVEQTANGRVIELGQTFQVLCFE